jgi:O-antigen/teichoic acid export membrane protein
MGYKFQALRGVSWITFLRILTRILAFARLGILGRFLTPTQFGYFGIASLILSLLEILTETGINIFLVQEKANIKEYLNSAWIVSIVRGVIIGFFILLSAPFSISFFNAQEAYLIITSIALVPVIRGFINPAIITYQKDLKFQNEFRYRSFLFFVDVLVSIIVGIYTKSAIGLIFGLIGSAIVEVILSFFLIPLWPKLKIESQKIKRVISRGWPVTLTGIFSYIADNGDTIVVGKLLGTGSLGIYQIAYKFSTLPISEITNVLNQVIFPVYSKFSDQKDRLLKAFLKVTIFSSIGALILGIMIYLFAEPIILSLMGQQWSAAIPVVKILSAYGIIRTTFGSFSALFLSVNRQDYVAKMVFFRVIGLLISVIPFIKIYGMVGAGYAMLFSVLLEIPITTYLTIKIFKKI